jgi:hypothetical protein
MDFILETVVCCNRVISYVVKAKGITRCFSTSSEVWDWLYIIDVLPFPDDDMGITQFEADITHVGGTLVERLTELEIPIKHITHAI